MKIAITGKPGIGKTTACLKVYEALKDKISIEGFITCEVREKRRRVGFKIRELKTQNEKWLAKVGDGKIKVGKYVVFVDAVDEISENIANYNADLIIIDEIGPMELKSRKFIEAVEKLINEDNNLLFSIHLRSNHPLLQKIRSSFEVFMLDEKNRNTIPFEISRRFESVL
ncbi:nucleoside triphosphatase [Archaeoglobales archaeon]|nr:MAG: nucleoside triphosphatase [Archaeoglobales archaeon]